MKKLKLGILGTSDIAFRRFLPALMQNTSFDYVGIASRNIEKTHKFIECYGGKGYASYDELIEDKAIDAIYIPLPPSLHYEWAKRALENGKHVLLEKPFTTSQQESLDLIQIAKSKGLALFENYMFMYHSQLETIKNMIKDKEVGDIRQYRMMFGFPFRSSDDFRYNESLGGGALLDCGGYTIKLATILLGDTAEVVCSSLNYADNYKVDMFGSATLQNAEGIVAQVAFGMDNAYKCELEVWGSKATITATRIFTAGEGFEPEIIISTSTQSRSIKLESDNQFSNAIKEFYTCISNTQCREKLYKQIELQAKLVEEIIKENKK